MAEERDEKDLTGDLAIDDESANEVTGGRADTMADASARAGAAEFFDGDLSPRRTTSKHTKPRRFKNR